MKIAYQIVRKWGKNRQNISRSPVEFTINYIYRCGNGNKWIGPTCVHCLVRWLRPCVRRPHELWVGYMQSMLTLSTAFGPPETIRHYATLLNCHVHPASSMSKARQTPVILQKSVKVRWCHGSQQCWTMLPCKILLPQTTKMRKKNTVWNRFDFYILLTHRVSSD